MVVPAGERDLIRRDLEQTLTDRCTTTRPADDANNWDGASPAVTVLADQPCRYVERLSREIPGDPASRRVVQATLYLPVGVEVDESHRVTSIVAADGTPRITASRGITSIVRSDYLTTVVLEGTGA